MKVLFTGGGTMGSVTPLIAVAEILKDKNPGSDLFWIGTKDGPEVDVVRHYNINFKTIMAGRLRRYFSWQNVVDFFRVFLGFVQALIILLKIRPRIIVSAGGFVAVPVVWAGWLLNIPSIVHQQDARVGLANRLCAMFAKRITVCWPETAQNFPARKTEVIGNPIRRNLKIAGQLERERILSKLRFKKDWPVVLVTTGGTGALRINELVSSALRELTKFCQVIQITGRHKVRDYFEHEHYVYYEFLKEIAPFLAVADLVVTRAGMGTLTEISYLAKPAIVIPIPNSHQEENAAYFQRAGAAEILKQEELESDDLVKKIKELLGDKRKLKELGSRASQMMKRGAEERLAEIVEEIKR